MGSTLERLDAEVKVPFDEEAILSGDPVRQAEYFRELVKTLQDILEKNAAVTNYGVDSFDGEAVYYGTKNAAGEYPNGTWRRIQVGDNLEDQVKIDGTWTFVQRRGRPI